MALKRNGSPRTARDVTPEIARKRLKELTPYQRIALRAFILAVSKGWGLPRRWERQALDSMVVKADINEATESTS